MIQLRAGGGARVLFVALAAAAILAALPQTSRALPLFGRKYGLQCTSCHIAAPRLNVFGMHFKQNGFRMPGAQGESPWDSTAKEFPLALVGNVAYHLASTSVDPGDGNRVRTSYGAFEQKQVEFHSAGTLGRNVTFHFDNNFAGAGGPLQSGMACVQLDDLMKDGELNVRAGIFDADIPYLAESRNTSLTPYLNDRVTLGASGIEVNGARQDVWYAVGLINSARDSAAVSASRPGTKTFNQLENFYVWVMREAGGNMYTARVYLDCQDPRRPNATKSLRTQADLSAFFDRGRFTLIPGYTYEKSQDQVAGTSDQSHTGLLEALCMLDKASHWALTARIEHQYVPKSNGALAVEDRSLGALNLAYYVNPNARFGVDWAHGSDNVHGPTTDDVQAFVWVGY